MTFWLPLISSDASVASLADGAAVIVYTQTLADPASGDELEASTIVNGWLDVHLYTSDGLTLSTPHGPVQCFLLLVPKMGTVDVTKFQTIAELKEQDEWAWMMLSEMQVIPAQMIRMRFDIRTKRNYSKGSKIVVVIQNNTGAALSANSLTDLFGELYIV